MRQPFFDEREKGSANRILLSENFYIRIIILY